MKLLNKINSPEDLRKLQTVELPVLAQELREFVVDVVSKEGGHLSASLGVIELTIAIHYLFNTPKDQLIWDVGHQAYGHKILTGRRDVFHTNRKFKGISGFPKRTESEYDNFGTGHSSTAISAILGMAEASLLNGLRNKQHVAVVGDGALTGGLSFEALNQAGVSNSNLIIIINDNSISIDENGGALKDHLAKLKSKEASSSKNIFENLGFKYFGPVDGHDLNSLMTSLESLKNIPGPKILHCITIKGKGYSPAETGNAVKWHAPGIFDATTGKVLKSKSSEDPNLKYQEVFGKTLLKLALKNKKIIGVTPAMPSGSSLNMLMQEIPERSFDVDIAEQHAVTFSAGMATQGFIPYCSIYSTFLQRAYDQLIHDVALQNLKVIFCVDRAGLVGEDGATHHGAYDLAFLRCIPNLIIASPINAADLSDLLYTAQSNKVKTPIIIRYPRGYSDAKEIKSEFSLINIGAHKVLKEGSKIVIISIGTIGQTVQKVVKELNEKIRSQIGHIDLRFVKPVNSEKLIKDIKNYQHIITIEDGCVKGGMGSMIVELLNDNSIRKPVINLGIPDEFIEHGSVSELHQLCGIDESGILRTIHSLRKTTE